MLTPDFLRTCADDIIALYDALNTSIIEDMVRRVAKIGITRTTQLQAMLAQESGALFSDIVKRISGVTGQSAQEVKAIFMQAGVTSLKYDKAIYMAAGFEPIALNQTQRMLEILLSGILKTNGILSNLTMTTAIAGQQAFVEAANLAYMQVASGAIPYTQATVQAVRGLAQQGVSVVEYAGSRDQLDVAVSRAVVTGVNQTMSQLQLAQMDQLGVDLVGTSAHYGARPSHRPWQGRIFSRSGRSEKYPEFRQATGYGTGAGLCGYNCRHSFFPYFEGSEPEYDPDDLAQMNKRMLQFEGKPVEQYEASQMQRKMERGIRATKRELAAFDAARNAATDETLKSKLTDQFKATSTQLKGQQEKLAQFVKETNLPRQREREQVQGFSRSQASKASWATRRRS